MDNEEIPQPNDKALAIRALDALDVLRGPEFTSLGIAGIKHERKAASMPDLGHQNHSLPFPSFSSRWGRKLRVDYKYEVGDLDLNSLAMAVVNFTANRIPEAKPAVVRRRKEDNEEKDFLHPMAKLVRRPNRHHIWANYAAAISMSWWFSGNVYLYKTRSMTAVEELWYLPHFLVIPRWPGDGKSPEVPNDRNNDPFLSHYQYTPPGKAPVLYPANDVIHLKRGVNLGAPREGLGAFEPLFKELYGDDKMALFTAAIMANMGIQVPVISPKDSAVSISVENGIAMKESWIAKTTGERAGEPVVMTEPIDIEKFGFNPTELDMSNLRLIPESRVCAVCQISPAALQLMVGIQNGTSYASSEQARQQGYEEVIVPIQSVWAEELTWQLLPDFEDSEDAEFVFDTADVRVLQEDRDGKYKRTAEAFRAGITTLNEARASLEKSNLGEDGDIYMIPSVNQPMTLEKLKELAADMTSPARTGDPLAADTIDVDKVAIAKFMDIDRMLAGLEEQMREFQPYDR